MSTIYLIRHGQSEANKKRIWGGDFPLTEEGKAQAAAVPGKIPVKPDKIVSSALKRVMQTAAIAYPGAEVEHNPAFNEVRFGRLELETMTEETLFAYHSDPGKFLQSIGGDDSLARAKRAVEEIEKYASEYENVAIFISNTLLMGIITLMQGKTLAETREYYLKNCEVITMSYDGELKLEDISSLVMVKIDERLNTIEPEKVKTGLVLEGGGMKCAYGSGVLDAFMEAGIEFDYVIGVSAGSANGASFVSGQKGRCRRFYTDHIKEKGYFGLGSFIKTGDLFGLDYIYSTISDSGGSDPLDYEAMIASPAELEIVATNAVTGKPEYFSKHDIHKDDYEIIKASSCIPAACRPRRVGEKYYYDGGMSDPIPVERALARGCGKIVAVLSKPRDYVRQPQGMKAFYRFRCRKFPETVKLIDGRHITYMEHFKRVFELEKQGKVFVFTPDKAMKSGTYKMDAEFNQKLYEHGVADFKAREKELREFLK